MNTLITLIFRILQAIPLFLVILPIFISYWEKRNTINGLRHTRVVLLILFGSIFIENLYFIYYAAVSLIYKNNTLTPDTFILIADKTLTLASYFLLYYLFSHARKHNDDVADKNQQI